MEFSAMNSGKAKRMGPSACPEKREKKIFGFLVASHASGNCVGGARTRGCEGRMRVPVHRAPHNRRCTHHNCALQAYPIPHTNLTCQGFYHSNSYFCAARYTCLLNAIRSASSTDRQFVHKYTLGPARALENSLSNDLFLKFIAIYHASIAFRLAWRSARCQLEICLVCAHHAPPPAHCKSRCLHAVSQTRPGMSLVVELCLLPNGTAGG
jgi:hypothetical protein